MSAHVDLDDLMTSKEVATFLGVKPNTLEIWRSQGKGPPYLKLGDAPQAAVRYLRSAVAAWAARRAFSSTSEHTAAVRAAGAPTFRVAPSAIPLPWEGTRQSSSQPSDAS